jgi:APA family basic amino acid/polyamine antiporter
MAKDGIFFRSIAAVNGRSGAPSRSIVLQGAIAAVMVLFGTFDQLLTYMGFSLGIFPLLAVVGVFKLRREGRTVVKMPGYPVTPALYLLFGTLILVLAFLQRPLESSIALGTVAVGVPVYLFFKRQSRRA